MAKVSYRGLPLIKSRKVIPYSSDEVEYLKNVFGMLSPQLLAEEINNKYYGGKSVRSAPGISAKLRNLGLTSTSFVQRHGYSEVEDRLLIDTHNEVGPSKCFKEYNKRIGEYNKNHGTHFPRRTRGGIAYRIRYIRLKKGD